MGEGGREFDQICLDSFDIPLGRRCDVGKLYLNVYLSCNSYIYLYIYIYKGIFSCFLRYIERGKTFGKAAAAHHPRDDFKSISFIFDAIICLNTLQVFLVYSLRRHTFLIQSTYIFSPFFVFVIVCFPWSSRGGSINSVFALTAFPYIFFPFCFYSSFVQSSWCCPLGFPRRLFLVCVFIPFFLPSWIIPVGSSFGFAAMVLSRFTFALVFCPWSARVNFPCGLFLSGARMLQARRNFQNHCLFWRDVDGLIRVVFFCDFLPAIIFIGAQN